jgi:putative glycosyltransferase (TIGR04372 family)
VPIIFRRPVAFVNGPSIARAFTFLKDSVFICKKFWLISESRWFSLKEIINHGIENAGSTSDYESKGIKAIENTPEEIRDVVIEMLERLKGDWQQEADDEMLQNRFWQEYPLDARSIRSNKPLHGKVFSRYGANFLRMNRDWFA